MNISRFPGFSATAGDRQLQVDTLRGNSITSDNSLVYDLGITIIEHIKSGNFPVKRLIYNWAARSDGCKLQSASRRRLKVIICSPTRSGKSGSWWRHVTSMSPRNQLTQSNFSHSHLSRISFDSDRHCAVIRTIGIALGSRAPLIILIRLVVRR